MDSEEIDIIKDNINHHKSRITVHQEYIDRLHKEIQGIRTKINANKTMIELLEKGLNKGKELRGE